jgi:signal transduction histidine kinase/HAMP domain-containing protein
VKKRSRTGVPPIGLASWLGGGSVIVVLIAVAAMALACTLLVDREVRQQGLVRAELAVTTARELLRRAGEDVLTQAQVLAERPALLRVLREGPAVNAVPLMSRYCESSGNQACALRGPGNEVVSTNAQVPWDQVAVANKEQGERFIVAPKDGQAPWWGATARVTDSDGWQVVVLRQATPTLLAEFGRQVDARLSVQSMATYQAPQDDAMTPLHSTALSTSRASATHLAVTREFAGSLTVTTVTGEVVALLDAHLPDSIFSAATRGLNRTLAVIALLVAAIAGVAGMLYGRWLARPVVALRDVAQRIGRGDLSASMPAVAPLEVGALARSMEEMRTNLLTLTESLRRREAEANALLGGIVEGVYAVDADRKITYVNPQVSATLRKPEREIIGRFCGDVLQPLPVNGERPCERQCPIIAARTAGQATARETLCLADGSTRSAILVSAAPVAGLQVQVLRDETDLEAVRRARDSVLGNISHEFRTPLAAQLASIELLRDGLDHMPRDAQGELLANVERGVLRLMRLIDNLLESVRIEAGQRSIRQQQVDLAEVVREAADLMQPLLAQQGLKLELNLTGVDSTIHGDSQRLMQVFVNLLSNAVKYAPANGTIHIGGARHEQGLEVWVDDEGTGIADADSSGLFERFRRGGEAVEPDAPGLGLGLWIVKSIVERHGGSIEATRTAEGHTRFKLLLPVEPVDAAVPPPEPGT